MGGLLCSFCKSDDTLSIRGTFGRKYDIPNPRVYIPGSTTKVYRCVGRTNRYKSYAVKIRTLKHLASYEIRNFKEGMEIWRSVSSCNFIAFLHAVYHEKATIKVVLEMVKGMKLYDGICSLGDPAICEYEVQTLMHQLIEAVKYCHDRDIVHRSISPDNIILRSKDLTIKLVGFSSARDINDQREFRDDHLNSNCLNFLFKAPETVKGCRQEKPADIWACGMIFYNLLSGTHPFPHDRSQASVNSWIRYLIVPFPKRNFDGTTQEARHVIKALLNHDPDKRWTAERAFEDRYFSYNPDIHGPCRTQPLEDVVARLRLLRKGCYIANGPESNQEPIEPHTR